MINIELVIQANFYIYDILPSKKGQKTLFKKLSKMGLLTIISTPQIREDRLNFTLKSENKIVFNLHAPAAQKIADQR